MTSRPTHVATQVPRDSRQAGRTEVGDIQCLVVVVGRQYCCSRGEFLTVLGLSHRAWLPSGGYITVASDSPPGNRDNNEGG